MDSKSMLKNLWLTSSLCNPHPDILHRELPTSSSPTSLTLSFLKWLMIEREREREREREGCHSEPKAAVKISSNL
jgi:hypothetical protein